ncbi:MAG: metallophosphoesterase family protein [Planctomycetales bacterium]|nr:metallophosphoesterase family protein [Planctomycetales bacterium]
MFCRFPAQALFATTMLLMGSVSPGFAQFTRITWPDPVAHDVMPYHTSDITHGPMLGKPMATSMRVWIRSKLPLECRVVFDTATPLTKDSPAVVLKTLAEADNTGFVDLVGLTPNTRYYYGIIDTKGLIDTRMEFDRPWPSFRTLPDETSFHDPLNNQEGTFNFAFSIGCCSRQLLPDAPLGIYTNPPSFLNIFQRHADDIAFHIVNGDFTYEEVLDGTRAGYAANYKLYLDRGRNMSNLFRYVPFMTMYDDHEVNSNLDGSGEIGLGDGDFLKRDDALSVWQQYAGWANDETDRKRPLRFGAATVERGEDILFDPEADFTSLRKEQVSTIHVGHFMKGDERTRKERGGVNIGVYGLAEVVDAHHLRVTPAFKASGQAPYSIGTHHYFDRMVGNCHFFFLDTRGERSKFFGEKRAHDPDRFILGDVQRKWFIDGVKQSKADFIFVISPDPWTIYHSGYHVKPEGGTGSKGDGFCGYVHEREMLIPELDAIQKPVMIFTGDVHNSFSVQITDNVWEFMVGPLNSAGHPIGTAGLPPFGGWFDSEGRKVKIKWVAGFPDNVHYSRQRNTYYGIVNINNIMKAARPTGVGYQFVPYDEPQAIIQFYDGYTGKLVYAESISTIDAKPEGDAAPKKSRWPYETKQP